MHINIKNISKNTIFFYKKQFFKILLIAIISTLMIIPINKTIIINKKNSLNLQNNNIYKNKNTIKKQQTSKIKKNEKKILINTYTKLILSTLIENTFLYIMLINTIDIIIKNKKNNNKIFIQEIINNFPRSLILTTIINILTEIGMIMFVIPGIIISSILSLSPIILILEKEKIINSIKKSILLTKNNIKIITFNNSLIFLMKIIVFALSIKIKIFSTIINFMIVHIINNLISSIQIIYVFRYYLLINKTI